ncbi:MAG TPA: M57 family metalloprotease [Chitinophagaceae bacterium]|nr:M57 family metalloprotease [Chitinophagaceae bacterium]
MKKILCISAIAVILFSCSKNEQPVNDQKVPDNVLSAIESAGFSKEGVMKEEGGYIVEGDIFISDQDIRKNGGWGTITIANTEQYHTTNTVSVGAKRNVTVSLSSRFPSTYIAGLDEAVRRYNAENLSLTFERVSSGADISIVVGNGNYIASAGFPSSQGDPYSQIKVNSRYLGSDPGTNFLATILSHEMGHCIGYRHTDYMDRSYSCGGSAYNEGESSVGAIHIPGTPTGPDAKSWMLSCISRGENRPFNNNDKTALSYLY